MRLLLEHKQIEIITNRLCYQLLESPSNLGTLAIVGLQPRGVLFARTVHENLEKITGQKLYYGDLDTTFYRDDFRRGNEIHKASSMNINFSMEAQHVVLVDDVLYTGRSVRAALDALNDFGRPAKVELMVLIDRRYSRQLPIQPDYVGYEVDSRADDKVKVEWDESGEGKIWLLSKENN